MHAQLTNWSSFCADLATVDEGDGKARAVGASVGGGGAKGGSKDKEVPDRVAVKESSSNASMEAQRKAELEQRRIK